MISSRREQVDGVGLGDKETQHLPMYLKVDEEVCVCVRAMLLGQERVEVASYHSSIVFKDIAVDYMTSSLLIPRDG